MAKQIYKSGNYVIVDNTPGDYQFSTNYSYFIEEYNNFIIIDKVNRVTIPISDAANYTDDSATAYTESTLRDFLITNTSSLSSSGSGGGGGSTPIGATLMKTGQLVSYRTGDDADISAGRETDFFTLASENPFGTTDRFTDELGGQTYTNNIVIDWSTFDGTSVLGYGELLNSGTSIDWNTAIDNSLTYTNGTFTSGWRLPNVNETYNLINENAGGSLGWYFNYAPLTTTGIGLPSSGSARWTSTTLSFQTLQAKVVSTGNGQIQNNYKTGLATAFPVRNFTVSGTTLT